MSTIHYPHRPRKQQDQLYFDVRMTCYGFMGFVRHYLGDGTLRSGKTISPHIVSHDFLKACTLLCATSTIDHHPTACEVMLMLDHVNMSGNAADIVKTARAIHTPAAPGRGSVQ